MASAVWNLSILVVRAGQPTLRFGSGRQTLWLSYGKSHFDPAMSGKDPNGAAARKAHIASIPKYCTFNLAAGADHEQIHHFRGGARSESLVSFGGSTTLSGATFGRSRTTGKRSRVATEGANSCCTFGKDSSSGWEEGMVSETRPEDAS